MSEPISEQLAAARSRIFDAELASAKLEVELELEQAKAIAYRVAHENTRLRDRIGELEAALGRRQRARQDEALGIDRLRLLERHRQDRSS